MAKNSRRPVVHPLHRPFYQQTLKETLLKQPTNTRSTLRAYKAKTK